MAFKKVTVKGFVFPDGSEGTFEGYLRSDIEPSDKRMHYVIRVFSEDGHYFGIEFSDKKKDRTNEPTIVIGDENIFQKITRCFTFGARVSPKTGILLV